MFTYLRFQDVPLKRKIEMIVTSSILMISVAAFVSIFCISKSYNKVLYDTLASNLSYSASEIYQCLREVDELADMILSNDTVQAGLPAMADSESFSYRQTLENNIYNILTNYLFNTASEHISYISVLQEDTIISTNLIRFRKFPYELRKELIRLGQEAGGSTIWITDYSEEYGFFLVKELREAKSLSLRPIGTLIINISPEALIEQTNIFRSSYEAPSILLLQDDNLVYTSSETDPEEVWNLASASTDSYTITTFSGQTVFAVKGSIPDYGWTYIAMVSYVSTARTLSLTISLCIAVILLCIAVMFLLSSRILTALTRHFDWLIRKMHMVGEGIYHFPEDEQDYSKRKDEIGQLHTNFNSMSRKIETLITENYTIELLKKEAQLKSLESQMDPHFLYNTLDSIHWRANAVGAEDIAQITTSLGNLLRISLSETGDSFTLRQEMNLVENYMAIQKLRYSHRLVYQYHIPEVCLDLQLPKFTIQPLLENAIRYGLDQTSEVCTISVSAHIYHDMLMIEVKNNGSSFEENLLEKLSHQEILPHGFGIGLLNIHKRLRIAYGEKYGLYLLNMEDEETGEEYAVVQVMLPVLTCGKDGSHAETSDC